MTWIPPAQKRTPRPRRGLVTLTLAALAALTVIAAPSALAAPTDSAVARATPLAKGPVGWDVFRKLDGMERMRPGEQVRQFSSFDRTGGNEDGFNGVYSCLSHDPDGQCVIADAHGAGEISSIWFTYAANSVAAIGNIRIELDGRVVLQANLQDLVNGRKGAPFVWPLVGNSQDTMGGTVLKVPMPYTSSMRIVTQNNPHFYHVAYRQFADASGVRTFDPSDKALDVVNRLRGYGVNDPKPPAPGARTDTAGIALAPGASMSIPAAAGPRQISQLQLRLPQAVSSPMAYDDGRAFAPGSSSFTMAVSPANQGIRLTRRYDQGIGHQRANLLIDGKPAGEWTSGPSVRERWGEQTIEVPPALTAGKSRITVTNAFVSSDLDVNEFRYVAHSKLGADWALSDIIDIGPNHPGEEATHGYKILGGTWEGLGSSRFDVPAAQVTATDQLLEGLRLRITFDGKTTVDSPVGEFFGSGLGKYATKTLMTSIDTTENGAFTSWYPMPYGKNAKIELVNSSPVAVTAGSVAVTSAPDPSLPADLAKGGTHGYFNATHHRADTVPGQEWNFLSAQGRGVFYGVTTNMRGHIPPGGVHQMNYLEGDERVYVDGSRSPSEIGTGTEDFYESGWYFMDAEAGNREGVTYSMPQAGLVSHESAADGCQYVCLNAYRTLMADAVPFGKGIEFDIEHGGDSDRPAEYSSTAYWYGNTGPSLEQSDLVDVADPASRALHGYTADTEETATVTSTFEGKGDRTPVTGTVSSSTGPVQFTVAVSQPNSGLRLHRVADQNTGFQRANVFVDNRYAGEWYQPLTNGFSRWLEDSYDIPASFTAGKAAVQVRFEPVDGAPAWTASRYTALSQLGDNAKGAVKPNQD
ncbi:glycoside hydrolase family 172 protein [Amycolatopsis minnesotensis]|uniref:DUF2961 domain-containing protein n=1 Tax=Amycolatopsis minnesotensis TaxID=337894 RepID=A0ABN2RXE1_9PSEU